MTALRAKMTADTSDFAEKVGLRLKKSKHFKVSVQQPTYVGPRFMVKRFCFKLFSGIRISSSKSM